MLGQRSARAAGVEVAEQIERLQQLRPRPKRSMEFKIRRAGAARIYARYYSAFIEQREMVEFFRLSERLRFGQSGRFKLGPWQHRLDGGKYIAAARTRVDERLAYPGVKPYFLVDRFAAGMELLGMRAFRFSFFEHLPGLDARTY